MNFHLVPTLRMKTRFIRCSASRNVRSHSESLRTRLTTHQPLATTRQPQYTRALPPSL